MAHLTPQAFSMLVAARGATGFDAIKRVDAPLRGEALEAVRKWLVSREDRVAMARALWQGSKSAATKDYIRSLDLSPWQLWKMVSAPLGKEMGFPENASTVFAKALSAKGNGRWRDKARALGQCEEFPTELLLVLARGEDGFRVSTERWPVLLEALACRSIEPGVVDLFVERLSGRSDNTITVQVLLAHPEGGTLVWPGIESFGDGYQGVVAGRAVHQVWLEGALVVWAGHPSTPVAAVVAYCFRDTAFNAWRAGWCIDGLARREDGVDALLGFWLRRGGEGGREPGETESNRWDLARHAEAAMRKKGYPFRGEVAKRLQDLGVENPFC